MSGMMGMMSIVSMAVYACIMLLVLAVLIVGLMVLLKVNRRLAEDSRDRARARSAVEAPVPADPAVRGDAAAVS